MIRALRLLALLAVSFAMWAVVSLLPTAAQPIAASAISIIIGAMVERHRANLLASEVAERHKAAIKEIGQAAMSLARDLDKANREIEALRGRK